MTIDPIESHHNPRIKRAIRLRTRRGRQSQSRFLIDGIREVERAIRAGIQLSELFVCPDLLTDSQTKLVSTWPIAAGVSVIEVTTGVFSKIAFGDRADGIVATSHYFDVSLASLVVKNPSLVIVLDSVEKPGNLGAIARTAEAAGIDALICTGDGTDPFNPNVIRASTGAVFTLPVAMATPDEIIAWSSSHGLRMVTCRPDAGRSYTEIDFKKPICCVLGNESTGLGNVWAKASLASMRVPMMGTVDSLNVSTTAAIVMFEARRQRD